MLFICHFNDFGIFSGYCLAKRPDSGLRDQATILAWGQIAVHRRLRLGRQQPEDRVRWERGLASSIRHFRILLRALLDRLVYQVSWLLWNTPFYLILLLKIESSFRDTLPWGQSSFELTKSRIGGVGAGIVVRTLPHLNEIVRLNSSSTARKEWRNNCIKGIWKFQLI